MYQYTATLKSSNEVLVSAHTLVDIEKELTRYINRNSDISTRSVIAIHHVKRNKLTGRFTKKLIKEISI